MEGGRDITKPTKLVHCCEAAIVHLQIKLIAPERALKSLRSTLKKLRKTVSRNHLPYKATKAPNICSPGRGEPCFGLVFSLWGVIPDNDILYIGVNMLPWHVPHPHQIIFIIIFQIIIIILFKTGKNLGLRLSISSANIFQPCQFPIARPGVQANINQFQL